MLRSAGKPQPGPRPILTRHIKEEEEEGGGEGGGSSNASMAAAGEEEPLSPTSILFRQPDFTLHIIAIMGFRTPIDPHLVRTHLRHTLLTHPRFCSLPVGDDKESRWVRREVDLWKHVIVPSMDPAAAGETPVEDYIAGLSETSTDPCIPLWDLHLLNVQSEGAAATAVLRVHHSLGDGVSLMSLLLACMRRTSNPDSLPSLPAPRTRKPAGSRHGVWWAVRLWWNTVVDVVLFVATALFLKDTETPLRKGGWGGMGRRSCRRRIVHRSVSFDDVKLVKNAMGTTVNDVTLGVTQAGLSRYLNRRYASENGEDRGSTQSTNNLPKNIRFRAPLFINLRPTPGIPVLAEMMSKGSVVKWGNHIGYVLLPFTIGLRDDPIDYVREAKATVDRKKHSMEALFTFPIADLVIKLFGIKAGNVISYRVPSHTTILFSNMIGPQEEVGFYGHPMSYLAPSCYGQPNALMIHIQSYMNKLTFVLSVDDSVIPDPYQLCDDLEESLKQIKYAILERSTTADF